MTVMETTTCFGLYWPSSGCLGNLRARYMHARARVVEIPTYAQFDKPSPSFTHTTGMTRFLEEETVAEAAPPCWNRNNESLAIHAVAW